MRALAVGLAACLAAGCAPSMIVSQPLADVDRARTTPAAADAARLAPQEYARAEQERSLAKEAEARHDVAAADLHAERALASYERAEQLSRLSAARADAEQADATLAAAQAEALRLSQARMPFEREADRAATELEVLRKAATRQESGPADPARDAARRLAARSLAAEGELLCGAARLLGAKDLGGADTRAQALSRGAPPAARGASGATHPPPSAGAVLDDAARARADCLTALTRARRAVEPDVKDEPDAILADLSAHAGWDPARNERGVVVTLRRLFERDRLSADAERHLSELGQVAASHSKVPIQIVLHDAGPPSAATEAMDGRRASAAVDALVRGGAAQGHVESVLVGDRLPVTDPADPRTRERNERVDVVFVSSSD